MKIGDSYDDSVEPNNELIVKDNIGRFVQRCVYGNSEILIIWSNSDGGNIEDVEIGFGKFPGMLVSRIATCKDGQNYLDWLLQRRFLSEDVLEFIKQTLIFSSG